MGPTWYGRTLSLPWVLKAVAVATRRNFRLAEPGSHARDLTRVGDHGVLRTALPSAVDRCCRRRWPPPRPAGSSLSTGSNCTWRMGTRGVSSVTLHISHPFGRDEPRVVRDQIRAPQRRGRPKLDRTSASMTASWSPEDKRCRYREVRTRGDALGLGQRQGGAHPARPAGRGTSGRPRVARLEPVGYGHAYRSASKAWLSVRLNPCRTRWQRLACFKGGFRHPGCRCRGWYSGERCSDGCVDATALARGPPISR